MTDSNTVKININEIEVMYINDNTFSTVNVFNNSQSDKPSCFCVYDKKFLNCANMLAARDAFFNVLNLPDNRNKSVICVGNYLGHYNNKNCTDQDCLDKGKCQGYVHGTHPYDENCKYDNCLNNNTCYGYTNVTGSFTQGSAFRKNNNIYNTRCLACCTCRCPCTLKEKNNKYCRFDIDLLNCDCICNDNCTNLEIQTFLSETAKTNEDDIRLTVYRGLYEELNLKTTETINFLDGDKHIFYNGGQARVNAFVELNNESNIEYFKNPNPCIVADDKSKKVNIVLYGEHDVLKKHLTEMFKNNFYKPDDSIGCFFIVPINKFTKVFPYLFSDAKHYKRPKKINKPINNDVNIDYQNESDSPVHNNPRQCTFHFINKPCYKFNNGCFYDHSKFVDEPNRRKQPDVTHNIVPDNGPKKKKSNHNKNINDNNGYSVFIDDNIDVVSNNPLNNVEYISKTQKGLFNAFKIKTPEQYAANKDAKYCYVDKLSYFNNEKELKSIYEQSSDSSYSYVLIGNSCKTSDDIKCCDCIENSNKACVNKYMRVPQLQLKPSDILSLSGKKNIIFKNNNSIVSYFKNIFNIDILNRNKISVFRNMNHFNLHLFIDEIIELQLIDADENYVINTLPADANCNIFIWGTHNVLINNFISILRSRNISYITNQFLYIVPSNKFPAIFTDVFKKNNVNPIVKPITGKKTEPDVKPTTVKKAEPDIKPTSVKKAEPDIKPITGKKAEPDVKPTSGKKTGLEVKPPTPISVKQVVKKVSQDVKPTTPIVFTPVPASGKGSVPVPEVKKLTTTDKASLMLSLPQHNCVTLLRYCKEHNNPDRINKLIQILVLMPVEERISLLSTPYESLCQIIELMLL